MVTVPKRKKKNNMGGPAIIDGQCFPEFDNFFRAPFEYGGLIWESAEHLYQALKFRSADYRRAINAEKDPQRYYQMGQSRKHALIPDFEAHKVQNMMLANESKFAHYPELCHKLRATRGRIVFHQSSPFWNDANAYILEAIRNRPI